MDIRLVTNVRADWPRIRASLLAVLAKAPEDWIPEDVYHLLKTGEAACHLCSAGLLITRRLVNEFTDDAELHVWIAHSEGDSDVIEAGLDLLRATAQRGGFARITFGSPRLGWSKRFPLVSATYEVPR